MLEIVTSFKHHGDQLYAGLTLTRRRDCCFTCFFLCPSVLLPAHIYIFLFPSESKYENKFPTIFFTSTLKETRRIIR